MIAPGSGDRRCLNPFLDRGGVCREPARSLSKVGELGHGRGQRPLAEPRPSENPLTLSPSKGELGHTRDRGPLAEPRSSENPLTLGLS